MQQRNAAVDLSPVLFQGTSTTFMPLPGAGLLRFDGPGRQSSPEAGSPGSLQPPPLAQPQPADLLAISSQLAEACRQECMVDFSIYDMRAGGSLVVGRSGVELWQGEGGIFTAPFMGPEEQSYQQRNKVIFKTEGLQAGPGGACDLIQVVLEQASWEALVKDIRSRFGGLATRLARERRQWV